MAERYVIRESGQIVAESDELALLEEDGRPIYDTFRGCIVHYRITNGPGPRLDLRGYDSLVFPSKREADLFRVTLEQDHGFTAMAHAMVELTAPCTPSTGHYVVADGRVIATCPEGMDLVIMRRDGHAVGRHDG